jgi:U6 snRNA-associated Sm-like protein LSm7
LFVSLLFIYLPFADPDDFYKLTDKTRDIGLVVCRGTSIILISQVDGSEEIENPFGRHRDSGVELQ